MAAKTPVKSTKKAAKAVKSSKSTTSATKYTAAQRKAYQAASKTAIQKAQLQHNSAVLRTRRLQGAVKANAKAAAKRKQLISARVARNAKRATFQQTVFANQAQSLRLQAAARLFKAEQIALNRQFAAAGEAIHARTTTAQTLTSQMATSISAGYAAAARKNALKNINTRKAKSVTTPKRKGRTGKSPYAAIGAAAGTRAARATPASKTRKAAGLTPAVNPQWIAAGNDIGVENCTAVAIANHLLYTTGIRVTDQQVTALAEVKGTGRLNLALFALDIFEMWRPSRVGYCQMIKPAHARAGMVVGFESERGPHCGVLMPGNLVVSWGEIVPLTTAIEECWDITWTLMS